MERVWEDAVLNNYNPFYLWLYGSQNYNLHTEKSDLDFKLIIIPSLDELIKDSKPISVVLEYPFGQVEIKDIRNYIHSAVKVNINFIELLTTKYYLTNRMYGDELRSFYPSLIQEMGIPYLRWCLGMMEQKYHALYHEYPSKMEMLSLHGYDPKQICHIARLYLLMKRYLVGNYSYMHEGWEREFLISLKNWEYSKEEVEVMAQWYLSEAHMIVDEYTTPVITNSKEKIIDLSHIIIRTTIEDKFTS